MPKLFTIAEVLELKNSGKLRGQFSIPEEVYRSNNLGAINNSGLTILAKSPAHYLESLQNPKEPTPAMKLGTMLHEAVLEPELYANRLVTEKIKPETITQIEAMRKAFWNHPFMENLLSNGQAEQSFIWNDPETGVLCKVRVDYYNPELNLIVDLKTSADASEFAKSCANYDYHQQAAFYSDGVAAVLGMQPHFVFIVVEKEPPYGVRLCSLDQDAIELGRDKYRKYLNIYANCLSTGRWPGYDYKIETIALPRWAYTNY